MNRIGDVMVSVDASSGPNLSRVKQMTIKFIFVASFLSMQHEGVRAKTGWLGSGATWLPADCFCSELALSVLV